MPKSEELSKKIEDLLHPTGASDAFMADLTSLKLMKEFHSSLKRLLLTSLRDLCEEPLISIHQQSHLLKLTMDFLQKLELEMSVIMQDVLKIMYNHQSTLERDLSKEITN